MWAALTVTIVMSPQMSVRVPDSGDRPPEVLTELSEMPSTDQRCVLQLQLSCLVARCPVSFRHVTEARGVCVSSVPPGTRLPRAMINLSFCLSCFPKPIPQDLAQSTFYRCLYRLEQLAVNCHLYLA